MSASALPSTAWRESPKAEQGQEAVEISKVPEEEPKKESPPVSGPPKLPAMASTWPGPQSSGSSAQDPKKTKKEEMFLSRIKLCKHNLSNQCRHGSVGTSCNYAHILKY